MSEINQITFSQNAILIVIGILAFIVIVVIVAFAMVVIKCTDHAFRIKGTRIWDYIVLTLAGCTTLILGLQGRLESQALAGLLGSMIGYSIGSHRNGNSTHTDLADNKGSLAK